MGYHKTSTIPIIWAALPAFLPSSLHVITDLVRNPDSYRERSIRAAVQSLKPLRLFNHRGLDLQLNQTHKYRFEIITTYLLNYNISIIIR